MAIVFGKPYQSGKGSRRLFQTFCIDDLVPEDHLLRGIAGFWVWISTIPFPTGPP